MGPITLLILYSHAHQPFIPFETFVMNYYEMDLTRKVYSHSIENILGLTNKNRQPISKVNNNYYTG